MVYGKSYSIVYHILCYIIVYLVYESILYCIMYDMIEYGGMFIRAVIITGAVEVVVIDMKMMKIV